MKIRKNRLCKQIVQIALGLVIFCSISIRTQAEEKKLEIVSFVTPAMQEVVIDEKVTQEAVLEKLPQTLEGLNEKNELVKISVSWECVGDYEGTNYYYYQFVPAVDSAEYGIAEGVELPYIWLKISPQEKSSRQVSASANETEIYNFLHNNLGCNFATALGILANIERESSFNPKAQYPAKGDPSYYGICQWGGSRLQDLKNYCEEKGFTCDSLEGQLEFLKHELYGTESKAWSKLQGIEDTPEGAYLAGYNWARYFERCAPAYYEVSAKRARDVYWANYATEAPVARIAGSDRYNTGFQIASRLKSVLGVEKFDNIVIATGKSFADALSGSYLAYMKKAPILLTNGNNIYKLSEYVGKNMKTSGTVYLLGGENVVSEQVEEQLKEAYQVKRLYGKTRYETNLEILKETGGNTKKLLVCTGKKFADSLSASAAGLPILLVSEKLTASQIKYLDGQNTENIYIIGGENVVNQELEKVLKTYGTVSRIAGSTRYETSILVGDAFSQNEEAAVLTYSKNFPDGLCGGPLAAALKAPLVLTRTEETGLADRLIQGEKIMEGYVLGGTKLISDDAVRKIFELKISERITLY